MDYHHIPAHFQDLVSNLYTDFHTSIVTDNFRSPAIPVKRGVLQGDCLSPLIFNLCFNTFIQLVKQDKHKQLGFSPHDGNDRLLNPVHWFQFADDAAVVTSDERENQLLLNCFTRWCQWANMIIRVDKSVTVGIKKFATKSAPFQPKLFINNDPVPFGKHGESFKYLGPFFNYDMENQEHKDHLTSSLREMLKVIDSLKIHPRNKILLFNQYILSKLSWDLTVANLSKTWVCENLGQLVT